MYLSLGCVTMDGLVRSSSSSYLLSSSFSYVCVCSFYFFAFFSPTQPSTHPLAAAAPLPASRNNPSPIVATHNACQYQHSPPPLPVAAAKQQKLTSLLAAAAPLVFAPIPRYSSQQLHPFPLLYTTEYSCCKKAHCSHFYQANCNFLRVVSY